MNRFKQILRPYKSQSLALLTVFLLVPVSSQSQEPTSLIVSAKGNGRLTTAVEEQKITSALVVLRQNKLLLISVIADFQLQAEGTWKQSASSSEEILLEITGGAVKGELVGSGKLLLSTDRKSIKELAINGKSSDGQKISVTFVAADSDPSVEGFQRGLLARR